MIDEEMTYVADGIGLIVPRNAQASEIVVIVPISPMINLSSAHNHHLIVVHHHSMIGNFVVQYIVHQIP